MLTCILTNVDNYEKFGFWLNECGICAMYVYVCVLARICVGVRMCVCQPAFFVWAKFCLKYLHEHFFGLWLAPKQESIQTERLKL